MFQDYLLYATDVQTQYAFRVVHLSHLVQQAAERHKLSGPSALLLSEVLTCGVLMASVLETEERVNLRIQCGSDFTLASETSCHAQTRGYFESTPSSEVVARLLRGEPADASVIVRTLRSLPGTTRLTEGVTQSRFESIEQVVNEHLHQSFQSKLRLKVGAWFAGDHGLGAVTDLRAFGVIYLELPGLDPLVEKKLHDHIDALKGFRELGALTDDPDTLVQELVPDLVRPVNSILPVWQCTCSMASVESMLLTLDPRELVSMASAKEPLDILCHYCGTNYHIDPERLNSLSLSVAAGARDGSGNKSQPN